MLLRFLSTFPFFITFIRAMNFVKAASFTTDYLDPNYRKVIRECDKTASRSFTTSPRSASSTSGTS